MAKHSLGVYGRVGKFAAGAIATISKEDFDNLVTTQWRQFGDTLCEELFGTPFPQHSDERATALHRLRQALKVRLPLDGTETEKVITAVNHQAGHAVAMCDHLATWNALTSCQQLPSHREGGDTAERTPKEQTSHMLAHAEHIVLKAAHDARRGALQRAEAAALAKLGTARELEKQLAVDNLGPPAPFFLGPV